MAANNQEPRGNTSEFKIDWSPATKTSETIKWSIHKEKFEIHHGLCNRFELHEIIPHCLTVMHKIDGQVGDSDTKKAHSYKAIMPRTLSIPLAGVWKQVAIDYELENPDEDDTVATFKEILKAFFAAHSTEDDRHELASVIRYAVKPTGMKVQPFFYCLKELNGIDWLPGDEPELSDAQLNLAFYNGMPEKWRGRHAISGRSAHTTTRAELIHYFRVQEHAQVTGKSKHVASAVDSVVTPVARQEQGNRAHRRQYLQNKIKAAGSSNGHKNGHAKFKKGDKNARFRVELTDPCPIHPLGRHTWGDCLKNVLNKDKKFPAKGSTKGKTTSTAHEANLTELDRVDPSIDIAINDAGTDIAINDPELSDEDETLVIELTNSEKEEESKQCDSTNINTFKSLTAAKALIKATRNGTSNDSIQVLVSLDESVTHHLDEILLTAETMQDPSRKVLSNEFLNVFTHYMDELSSNGDCDVKLNFSKHETQSSRLRSSSIAIVGSIQQTKVNHLLKVLFDSGSDTTIFKRSSLPQGIEPSTGKKRKVSGVTETSVIDQYVMLKDITLPEFSSSQRIPGPIKALLMPMEAQYDLIVGMDIMQIIGLDLHNSSKTIVWNGNHVPFKSHDYFDGARLHDTIADAMDECPLESIDDTFPVATTSQLGYKSRTIQKSLYEQVDIHDVAIQQKHLSAAQQAELEQILSRYPRLFSGELGCYPHRKVHLDLKANAIPCCCRPYPVPRHHEQVFREDLDRLCEIGVLSRCGASQWLSPSFIIPKKDGRVRWISDFRKLNEQILRKVYHLPKIQDILNRRSGYTCFTKLDISMQYYTFELDEPSKEVCTICTPFGNYKYNRLPMGVSQAPDISQEIMEDLFRNFNEVDVYMDDVGVFSQDWETHRASLSRILNVLETNGFTVNPAKCEWAVTETDWLGYWLTPNGLKPWKKKISAIIALKRPETVKQLRSFIGAVNFYRDMYPQRSH
jgi:hypothetical protein